MGVRTGASLVEHGETGILIDRLPPGKSCVANDADQTALGDYLGAVQQAQTMDRHRVRAAAAEQFATDRIVEALLRSVVAIP